MKCANSNQIRLIKCRFIGSCSQVGEFSGPKVGGQGSCHGDGGKGNERKGAGVEGGGW